MSGIQVMRAAEAVPLILAGHPPEVLMVDESLHFTGEWPEQAKWPDRLILGGGFTINDVPNIKRLPRELVARNQIWVSQCPQLTQMPQHMIAGGRIDLMDCLGVEALGEETKAESLMLLNCPALTNVNRLLTWGNLIVDRCPNITEETLAQPSVCIAGEVRWLRAEAAPGLEPTA